MLVNQPTNVEFERENLASTILQFVVNLIPQEHIRMFLQNDVLPLIFSGIFKNFDYKPNQQDKENLSYDFLGLQTHIQEQKRQKLKQKVLKQNQKQLVSELNQIRRNIQVNFKLVRQLNNYKVQQRYMRICFEALKQNVSDALSDSINVMAQYLEQKKKYEKRHNYLLISYRAIQNYSQETIIMKLKDRRETQRKQIKEQEKMINHLQQELQQSKEEKKLLKQKVDLQAKENESREEQIFQLRNELQGVKPAQVGSLLRSYYQFLFCNPYLMRFRMHETSQLPCSRDCDFITKSINYVEDSKSTEQTYLEHLLKESEQIENNGQGLIILTSISLEEYLLRWTNYIQQIALSKLNDVIKLYEDQIDIKNWQSKQFKGGKRPFVKSKSIILPQNLQDSFKNSDKHHLLENALKEISLLKNFLNALKNEKPSELYRLAAVLFVLDTTYKFVQLDLSTSLPLSVWKTDIVPDYSLQLQSFIQRTDIIGKMQIFELEQSVTSDDISEINKEQKQEVGEICFIPDLKPILQYLNTKSERFLVQYAENLTHTSLQDLSIINIILFLYLFNSQLQVPKNILKSSQDDLSNSIHNKITKWAMLGLEPLVSRTKHQNIQDITVLTDAKSTISELLALVNLPRAEILVRWINYQLAKILPLLSQQEKKIKPTHSHITSATQLKITAQNNKSVHKSQNQQQLTKQNTNLMKADRTIKSLDELIEKDYTILILLLMNLAPEVIFKIHNLYNQVEMDPNYFRMIQVALAYPNSNSAKKFLFEKSDRIIFIMQAIQAVTGKISLTFSQLYDFDAQLLPLIEEVICQLFLARPYMIPHLTQSKLANSYNQIQLLTNSLSDYLSSYGKAEFNKIEEHMLSINKSQPQLIANFAVLVDSETIYQRIREKMSSIRMLPLMQQVGLKPMLSHSDESFKVNFRARNEIFAQREVLDLFKEGNQEFKHELLNNVLEKYNIPLMRILSPFSINNKVSYYAAWMLLEKFTQYIDSKTIEYLLLAVSNFLQGNKESNEQKQSGLHTPEEIINDIQVVTQLQHIQEGQQVGSEMKDSPSKQNLSKMLSISTFGEKVNPLGKKSQIQLLEQRKILYNQEFKIHQFLAVLVGLCFNREFLQNYLKSELLMLDDSASNQFNANTSSVFKQQLQQKYDLWSIQAQDLFFKLTGSELNTLSKTTSNENLVNMIVGPGQAAFQRQDLMLDFMISNFLLCKTKSINHRPNIHLLQLFVEDETKWFRQIGIPFLLQPLYDYYLYQQTANMSSEVYKKFLEQPILLISDGLRKFNEDFASVFPRVSKEIFFNALIIPKEINITFFGFVQLIQKLSYEQNHFQPDLSPFQCMKTFVTQLKNFVYFTIKPKANETKLILQSYLGSATHFGNTAALLLELPQTEQELKQIIQHRRRLILAIEYIKNSRLF